MYSTVYKRSYISTTVDPSVFHYMYMDPSFICQAEFDPNEKNSRYCLFNKSRARSIDFVFLKAVSPLVKRGWGGMKKGKGGLGI